MTSFVTLMYHAVYDGAGELEEIDPVDRPYAVSVTEFESHLDLMQRQGVPVIVSPGRAAIGRTGAVQLSFDDGHSGWFTHVLPALAKRRLEAVFFVTSDFIGRHGYCDAVQIKALSDAGMRVGGHGKSHGFLSDMDQQQCLHELDESRRVVESIIGKQVTCMSFPGGRYSKTTLALAESVGYSELYTSIPGVNSLPPAPGSPIMRFDIRPGIALDQLEKIINQDSGLIRKVRFIAGAKKGVKRILGSDRYKRLYDRVYSERRQ